VIASADGGKEQVVHAWHDPEYVTPVFFGSPAWSPDGEVIACAVNDQRGPAWLTLIRAADGSERGRVQGAFTFASQAAWLSNDELVLVASITKLRRVAGTFGAQLWRVSLPAGLTEQITKDTFDYRSPTATANGSMIAAVVNAPYTERLRTSMSGTPARNLGLSRRDGALGLEQAADGRVVFASPEGLYVTATDGSPPRLLTNRSELGFAPAVAPDGRTVVYETFVNGKPQLCRTSVDGGPPVGLCDLPSVVQPSISSDGKSVYFSVLEQGQQLIEREPMEGGRPAIVARLNMPAFRDANPVSNPIISPEGNRVAMFSADPQSPGLTVITLRDGSRKIFPNIIRSDRAMLRWLADGSDELFSGTTKDGTNVWLQKLDGSAARPLTNFRDLDLFRFDCCRDGEMLLLRGKLNRDAVLLRTR
jgi:Tol biopolymer transport system component